MRPAEERDYDGILRLLGYIAELHHRGRPDIFTTGRTKYTKEELAALCAAPDTPVFCAHGGDGLGGYIFCRIRQTEAHGPALASRVLFIDDLCVDERKRRSGAGAALFARAEALAVERGCSAVELNLWEFNEGAARFYEKMGMRTKRRILEKRL